MSYKLIETLKREDKRAIEAKQVIAWMLMQKSEVVVATAVKTLGSPAFSTEDFLDKIPMYLEHSQADVRLMAVAAANDRLNINEDLTAIEPILQALKSDADTEVANYAKRTLSGMQYVRSSKCRAFFQ